MYSILFRDMDWLAILTLTTHRSISIWTLLCVVPSYQLLLRVLMYKSNVHLSSWMFSNRLKINMHKTQFIWLGSHQQQAKINIRMITLANVDICNSVDMPISIFISVCF